MIRIMIRIMIHIKVRRRADERGVGDGPEIPPGVGLTSRVVGALLDAGVPLGLLRVLATTGRVTGSRVSTPVAVVMWNRRRWIVSPFGDVGGYETRALTPMQR